MSSFPSKILFTVAKWLSVCLLIGFFVGLSSAFFLSMLAWVTELRETYPWLVLLLPLGGFVIGYLYYYYGKEAAKGTNLILEEYQKPTNLLPTNMTPLVLFGTLVTHLLGGSAGREGTAVQMGAALADTFSRFFKVSIEDRKTILVLGISAGFASVFGTPWAGAIFALELFLFQKFSIKTFVFSFLVAHIAATFVYVLGVNHTNYTAPTMVAYTLQNFAWLSIAAIIFGLVALIFSKFSHFFTTFFSKYIVYPPFRPLFGGLVLVGVFLLFDAKKFMGLGIPIIQNAFLIPNFPTDFLVKLLLTTFTLGAGFKGGEVTPLFFVGATLGSALSLFLPLPISLLAAVGFIAVFAGATHTPFACTVMGLELFGVGAVVYFAFGCAIAYFFSGRVGIYSAQMLKGPKILLYDFFTNPKKS